MEALIKEVSQLPGFGFHPKDVELIAHYLRRKNLGLKISYDVIPEVDIYKHEPWDLPEKCRIPSKDKWHFFTSRDRKYPNGSRTNRATLAGYWKSTGRDRNIKLNNQVIGTKKTLVFHEGRPPCGKRSDWIMHEYYINENRNGAAPYMKDYFVLCRINNKNGWPLGQNEFIQTEETNNDPDQPEDMAGPMVCKEPSSPFDNVNDLEEWIKELHDPNFSGISSGSELDSRKKADLSLLAPKQEPVESSLHQSVADDDFLSPDDIASLQHPVESGPFQSVGDDYLNFLSLDDFIMQPDPDNFNCNIFGEPEIVNMGAASIPQLCHDVASDDLFLPASSFVGENGDQEKSTAHSDENTHAGIQIRPRGARRTTEIPNDSRIRLQLSMMKTGISGSVNHTVMFDNQDHHLELNDGYSEDLTSRITIDRKLALAEPASDSVSCQSNAEASLSSDDVGSQSSLPCTTTSTMTQPEESPANPVGPQGFGGALFAGLSCIQAATRGLSMLLRGSPSAGLNSLFFGACMLGTAAVLLYFLLRDARRFLTAFSYPGL